MQKVISFELLMLKSVSGVESGSLLRVYVKDERLITRHNKSTFKKQWIVKRLNRGEANVKKIKTYG